MKKLFGTIIFSFVIASGLHASASAGNGQHPSSGNAPRPYLFSQENCDCFYGKINPNHKNDAKGLQDYEEWCRLFRDIENSYWRDIFEGLDPRAKMKLLAVYEALKRADVERRAFFPVMSLTDEK